jgi:hypothetical protein
LLRTGARSIQLLEWWSIPRRGWIIILSELAVIIGLAGWAYSEYLNNAYFQGYVNSLSPVLVPIVSVGFGITSATVATMLYFTMKNMKQSERTREEDASTRRGSSKKIIKKQPVSASARERASAGGLAAGQNPRGPVGVAFRPKRGGTQSSSAETSESEQRTAKSA